MTKRIKHSINEQIYPDLIEKPQKIPNKLNLLSCVPSNATSYSFLQKRRYFSKKIEFSTISFSQKAYILKKAKKSYVTHLETYVREYFKYLNLWKHTKTFKSVELTVYSKYSNRVARKVWRTMYSTSITSLTIEYPYQAQPAALLKLLIFHRHLENLSFERLYSTFVLSAASPWKVNLKRYQQFWESKFLHSLKTLRLYMGFLGISTLESFILKLKSLKVLELESNNDSEDEALIKLIPKLTDLKSLEKLSLTLSECSSEHLLVTIINELQVLQLKELTLLIPICRNLKPYKLVGQFPTLETLNLAISQSHRGHDHTFTLENANIYNFFSNFSFSNIKRLGVILEKYPSNKENEISPELESFLNYLITLRPTLKHLIIRFYGKSLEYYEWERVLDVVGTLEGLESLELSEVSFFNNFCIGLVSNTLDKLPKLNKLCLRPVTLTKQRFLKTFTDKVVAHPSLKVLYLMISRFSSVYVPPLLKKLKEFKLRTKLNGDEGALCKHEFAKRNQSSVLSPLFFEYTRW